MSVTRFRNVLGAVKEAYEFFSGGDAKMAVPMAKIFLCLSVILGTSTYIMAEKYFAIIDDSRKMILSSVAVEKELNRLAMENENYRVKLAEVKTCEVREIEVIPKLKPPYEEVGKSPVSDKGIISRKRLATLLND